MKTKSGDKQGRQYWTEQKRQGQEAAAKIPQVEIWRDDATAFHEIAAAIFANKRLAWEIVSLWCEANHKRLIDYNPKQERVLIKAARDYKRQQASNKGGQL